MCFTYKDIARFEDSVRTVKICNKIKEKQGKH